MGVEPGACRAEDHSVYQGTLGITCKCFIMKDERCTLKGVMCVWWSMCSRFLISFFRIECMEVPDMMSHLAEDTGRYPGDQLTICQNTISLPVVEHLSLKGQLHMIFLYSDWPNVLFYEFKINKSKS